ncbi:MAG: hypothetical protein ACJ74Y_02385 [Bryobacteraceae bacterium]
MPAGQPAFLSIDFIERNVRISNNGSLIQEFSLPRPMVDARGPIALGSWIGGMAPFSGKIQFFEIVGL